MASTQPTPRTDRSRSTCLWVPLFQDRAKTARWCILCQDCFAGPRVCETSANASTHRSRYLVAKGDIGMKIPDNVSDEEASTLGVGISTVGKTSRRVRWWMLV